ncbi:hypothetical protein L228DRAFT_242315 [Xylona heveae TC161]|uniref:SnoaL-like domain-containing protein n=1 Tax=Xylona heveae (strain CBS 132557 / TC161) TaxID=1328760 RepID=A0A165J9F5_XYLHT|nr:hypothetical protein L228DRAFT_242315 [Xylona heveae TC161]KZF25930.1 hypothetical protein L228DRAFT_242315 [Xylona heveae TC161]
MTSPTAANTSLTSRTAQLRARAHSFCQAFLEGRSPSETLSTHFVRGSPKITEHGPAIEQLPFLGRTFVGRSSGGSPESVGNSCDDYFTLLSETLRFHPHEHTFPSQPGGYIVDAGSDNGNGTVNVVGTARFESIKTGKSWEETFIYRLSGFDDDGLIGHWEIWADPLSAWLAVEGKAA